MAQRKGLSFHTWQTLRDLFILVLHILLETVRIFNIFNIVYYKGILTLIEKYFATSNKQI